MEMSKGINFKRTINKVALFSVLLDSFFKIEFSTADFRAQYIVYALYIIIYIFVYRTITIKKNSIIYGAALVLVLSLVPLFQGSGMSYYIKQLILITLNISFAYLLINAYKFDFEAIYKDYIQFIFIAACVGLIQAISLFFDFYYGADFSYLGFEMGNFGLGYTRIQSWFEEPTAMAYAFLPVVFICIARIFKLTELVSLRKAIFIISMFMLTQSSVGLIGLLMCLVIIVFSKYSIFRKPHYLAGILVFLCILGYGFYFIPLVKLRVDDSVKLFFDKNVSSADINRTNLSTYALYSNYKVVVASFKKNPLFGTGLGTHELNYNRSIGTAVPENDYKKQYQLNKKDANSLLLRIISEVGIFGLVLMTALLVFNRIKFRVVSKIKELNYWAINNGIFVLIIVRLLRQGHYTMLGFILFLLIYFFTRKRVMSESLNKTSDVAI